MQGSQLRQGNSVVASTERRSGSPGGFLARFFRRTAV